MPSSPSRSAMFAHSSPSRPALASTRLAPPLGSGGDNSDLGTPKRPRPLRTATPPPAYQQPELLFSPGPSPGPSPSSFSTPPPGRWTSNYWNGQALRHRNESGGGGGLGQENHAPLSTLRVAPQSLAAAELPGHGHGHASPHSFRSPNHALLPQFMSPEPASSPRVALSQQQQQQQHGVGPGVLRDTSNLRSSAPVPPGLLSPHAHGHALHAASSSPSSSSSSHGKRGRPRADTLSHLISEGSSSPSGIKCNICNRVFPRDKSLQAHLRTHTGEKPYLCDYPGCTRAFTQSGQMKTHQRLHSGEKPFMCPAPGCSNRYTHANRTCPRHPYEKTQRTTECVLEPDLPEDSKLRAEVELWLENYRRGREEKAPLSTTVSSSNNSNNNSAGTPVKTERKTLKENECDDANNENVYARHARQPLRSKRDLVLQLEQENVSHLPQLGNVELRRQETSVVRHSEPSVSHPVTPMRSMRYCESERLVLSSPIQPSSGVGVGCPNSSPPSTRSAAAWDAALHSPARMAKTDPPRRRATPTGGFPPKKRWLNTAIKENDEFRPQQQEHQKDQQRQQQGGADEDLLAQPIVWSAEEEEQQQQQQQERARQLQNGSESPHSIAVKVLVEMGDQPLNLSLREGQSTGEKV